MKTLIYKNSRGESITINTLSPFLIHKYEGLNEIKELNIRYIDLEGSVIAETSKELKKHRRELMRVFNKTLTGKLTYIENDIHREIECRIENITFGSEHQLVQKFLINIICDNPYWNDIEESKEIKAFINLFEFPIEFPCEMGLEGSEVTIDNNGDISTPVKIVMKGAANNPVLLNKSTGEFIKINRGLKSNDILIINTEIGKKRVEVNGENAYFDISLDSTLFELMVGENIIAYESDDGAKNATIEIIYKHKYIGV